MKDQAICTDSNIRKRFFLLMIAPILIGLMITLTTTARAEWRTEDPLLNKSPTEQGWKPIKIYKTTEPPSRPKKQIEKKSWWAF